MERAQTETSRRKVLRLVSKSITVSFPAKGGVQVNPQTETVRRRQGVKWRISCENQKVLKVQVEFEDSTRHHFFPDQPKKHTKKEKVDNGKATLLGKCPNYPVLPKDERAKYTVRGLDRNGILVPETELDPVLITPKP